MLAWSVSLDVSVDLGMDFVCLLVGYGCIQVVSTPVGLSVSNNIVPVYILCMGQQI